MAITLPGWSAELGGRQLDHRGRCPGVFDDQIFAARDAAEAMAIGVARLSGCRMRHAGFRRRAAESSDPDGVACALPAQAILAARHRP